MSGRERVVYMLEPILVEKDGSITLVASDFWTELHALVKTLSNEQRSVSFRNVIYRGSARVEVAPAFDYLYLGKQRPETDWPDKLVGEGDEESLIIDGLLVEPVYILPVGGTNYAAFLRTSGGPSWEAVRQWISKVLKEVVADRTFDLRPYVRADQIERLAAAVGASKLHLRFDAGSTPDPESRSVVARSVRQLQSEMNGGVTIDLTLSFGRAEPDQASGQALVSELRSALGIDGLRAAAAVVLRPRKTSGTLARDHVDFMIDRVTYKVVVGRNSTDKPTPPLVLKAMSDAVTIFREHLKEARPDGDSGPEPAV